MIPMEDAGIQADSKFKLTDASGLVPADGMTTAADIIYSSGPPWLGVAVDFCWRAWACPAVIGTQGRPHRAWARCSQTDSHRKPPGSCQR